MNQQEAFAVLGIEDEEDAFDAYESLIFEQQKFMLSNPVLLKTFQSRLKKAERAYEAYRFLEPAADVVSVPEVDFQPDEILSKHFLNYFASKNKLKQLLSASTDFPVMKIVAEKMIDLERRFVEPFRHFSNWTDENVLVSKEPDFMELLALIRQLESERKYKLVDFYEMKENLPEMLAKELKRLSLLTNYLYE